TVEAMFAGGLVEEVVGLAERYRLWEPARLARSALGQTHGYREFLALAHTHHPVRFVYSQRELAQVQAEIQAHTREYARRQLRWLKKMPPATPAWTSWLAPLCASHAGTAMIPRRAPMTRFASTMVFMSRTGRRRIFVPILVGSLSKMAAMWKRYAFQPG